MNNSTLLNFLNLNNNSSQLSLFITNHNNYELSRNGNHRFIYGEFWSSKQRQGHSLHEIAYRACFKPQLPNFFITRFSNQGDTIYDPFSGRGTTIIEGALMGRNVILNDINPLSRILTEPRLSPPNLIEIQKRLEEIKVYDNFESDIDLSMFYHKKTLNEILSLRKYLLEKKKLDYIDKWIRMVATNRLTGHSNGYFSVYTLPPNQAVSPQSQLRINKKYNQSPEYRDVKSLILKKSDSLLRDLTLQESKLLKNIRKVFLTEDAANTREIPDDSVDLVVTSPPFLNIVQYAKDNWLRCWFNNINVESVDITTAANVKEWQQIMKSVLKELHRVTKHNGKIAFEVGEVRNGKINLEDYVIPAGESIGFTVEFVLVNEQKFTKTSNIWGIGNNAKGTNSNRVVVFSKV